MTQAVDDSPAGLAEAAGGRPGYGIATLRRGTPDDADAIFRLITEHLVEGHLLARGLDEIRLHAGRFFVATSGDRIVACAELAPLTAAVAEIRSLVVEAGFRGSGIGSQLVDSLEEQAREQGYRRLCAFTHQPAYFLQHGFSIVPHVWLPEKIQTDCHRCPLFMGCGQYAVVLQVGLAPTPAEHG